MNDYERIAEVIHFLDEHQNEQPDLATLAQHAGLSPSHLHRLFSSWAGVTPKDFLQCLTLVHARRLLREGAPVLEAALAAGLSGPGRLHDLCVTLDAASPGEWKSGGAEWTIVAGFASSPFGTCLIGESRRGICHLSFPEAGDRGQAWAELEQDWPSANVCRDDRAAASMAKRVFADPPSKESGSKLRVFVQGTAFQVRVWRALIQVPAGKLISYGALAAGVGQRSAARAVGSAVGRNSVAYLIPCHRVIRETGVIGEYRWGTVRKRAILAWESARAGQSNRTVT